MKKKVLIGVLSIFFLTIMILVLLNQIDFLDTPIYQGIYQLRNNTWDSIFKSITRFGNILTVLCISIVLMLTMNKKNQFIFGINIILNVLSNQMLKNIIQRPRPDHIKLIVQSGYSFPSGHAMISIALYGFIIYLIAKKPYNKYIKIISISLLTLLILGIGCSRIYVGVHYPSDVISGYSLALIILIIVIHNKDKLNWGDNNDKDGSK